MAKHFKQVPAESTVAMKRTKRRGSAKHQASVDATEPQPRMDATVPQARLGANAPQARIDVEGTGNSMPYGAAASYRASVSRAATTGEFYMGDVPARGGARAVGRGFLLFFAWVVRLAAYAMVILVLLNVLSLSILRPTLTVATDLVTSYLPWRAIGLLEVDTPFGGVFRGDLALIALALFIIDWLLCKARASLR